MQNNCRKTYAVDEMEIANSPECLITSIEPVRPDADKSSSSDDLKIALIANKFQEIMQVLGLDLTDDSLTKTPMRVATMFVKEIFSGLDPANRPHVALFENKFKYAEMLVERDINVYSVCEHHFLPIIGKALVAYIPGSHVIGLSKITRIVEYVSRRPQIQEKLTVQIADELKAALGSDDVAVVVEAHHLCVAMRGVRGEDNCTITASFSGKFQDAPTREAFLKMLPNRETAVVRSVSSDTSN